MYTFYIHYFSEHRSSIWWLMCWAHFKKYLIFIIQKVRKKQKNKKHSMEGLCILRGPLHRIKLLHKNGKK